LSNRDLPSPGADGGELMTELPQEVLAYLGEEKTVTLATASPDGDPHASTFMYANDGLAIYFWARPTSRTARQLQANPRVSFTIDEYVPDWNKAKGVQGSGECVMVSAGDEVAKAVGLFAEKFPSPTSGASTTNIAFFRINPGELQFINNAGAHIAIGDDEFGMNFHREKVL
jgi:nitroimidazol reductase NimA-like FMN-containing flavoprotein (pyridoxamine 5'-phosphate oxidase superfamily)